MTGSSLPEPGPVPGGLARDEPLHVGIRRGVAGALRGAAGILRSHEDPDVAVHEVRKALKEARAILRLARAGLGEGRFHEERVRLRDLGRELAAARDDRVLGDTLRTIAGDIDRASVRDRLLALAPPPSTEGSSRLPPGKAGKLAAALERASATPGAWPAGIPTERDVRHDLGRTHGAGRRRMRVAAAAVRDRGSDADPWLHEWRKRTKDLWHQMLLFEPAWPTVIGTLAAEQKALSDALGTHHDLYLAAEWLGEHHPSLSEAVGEPLERRLAGARADAFRAGPRLHAERSGAFGKRLLAVWRVWRAAG